MTMQMNLDFQVQTSYIFRVLNCSLPSTHRYDVALMGQLNVFKNDIRNMLLSYRGKPWAIDYAELIPDGEITYLSWTVSSIC